jgi:hypothetical protein
MTPLLLILLWLLTSCVAPPDREVNVAYFNPDPSTTQLQITYRAPPPPKGKVYILWVVNLSEGKRMKVGELPPSPSLKLVRATADFYANGVIVSVENSPDADRPSNTWVLASGVTSLTPTAATPTP